MEKIISLPFQYEEKEYYTLVRAVKNTSECFELRITIMNTELQSKLGGEEVFIVKDGQLQVNIPSEARDIGKLKLQIAEALNKYFNSQPLTS